LNGSIFIPKIRVVLEHAPLLNKHFLSKSMVAVLQSALTCETECWKMYASSLIGTVPLYISFTRNKIRFPVWVFLKLERRKALFPKVWESKDCVFDFSLDRYP
jgi:hypothetical protein